MRIIFIRSMATVNPFSNSSQNPINAQNQILQFPGLKGRITEKAADPTQNSEARIHQGPGNYAIIAGKIRVSESTEARKRNSKEPLPTLTTEVFGQIQMFKNILNLNPQAMETLQTVQYYEQQALEQIEKSGRPEMNPKQRSTKVAKDLGLIKDNGKPNTDALSTRMKRIRDSLRGKITTSLQDAYASNDPAQVAKVIDTLLKPAKHGISPGVFKDINGKQKDFFDIRPREKRYLEVKKELLEELSSNGVTNIVAEGVSYKEKLFGKLNSDTLFVELNNGKQIISDKDFRQRAYRATSRALIQFDNLAIQGKSSAHYKREQYFDAIFPDRLNSNSNIRLTLERRSA